MPDPAEAKLPQENAADRIERLHRDARRMAQKEPPTVQVGDVVGGREVVEAGLRETYRTNAVAVKFKDGKYAVVYRNRESGEQSIWRPDNQAAAAAIAASVEMPRVRNGIGSDVLHVIGRDGSGPFLVRMYYNYKKIELGREDTLERPRS